LIFNLCVRATLSGWPTKIENRKSKIENQQSPMPVAVFKLGGSLLDLADLPDRLRSAIAMLAGDQPLLICGGGAAADVVRHWYAAHKLNEEQSHWLAMDSIRLNQRLLLTLMPELELVSTRAATESAWRRGRVPLLDLMSFVRIEEAAPDVTSTLPHSWDVTSDSLAGWVAIRWPASRLILLKSVALPLAEGKLSSQMAADLKLVDAYWPTLEADLPPTFWCDLRSSGAIRFCSFGR
jgi:aspartokinase-like uncharacterized kinase